MLGTCFDMYRFIGTCFSLRFCFFGGRKRAAALYLPSGDLLMLPKRRDVAVAATVDRVALDEAHGLQRIQYGGEIHAIVWKHISLRVRRLPNETPRAIGDGEQPDKCEP